MDQAFVLVKQCTFGFALLKSLFMQLQLSNMIFLSIFIYWATGIIATLGILTLGSVMLRQYRTLQLNLPWFYQVNVWADGVFPGAGWAVVTKD